MVSEVRKPKKAVSDAQKRLTPDCLTQVPQMAEIRNAISRLSGDVSDSSVFYVRLFK